MSQLVCSKTNRPIIHDAVGRNRTRYCIVNGKGYKNQRFDSFHKFCKAIGIDAETSKSLRTLNFQHQHLAVIDGYLVEMFYNHLENK